MERDRVNDDSPGQSESLNIGSKVRRGPPLGRHIAAVAVTVVLMLVFWLVFWLAHRIPIDPTGAPTGEPGTSFFNLTQHGYGWNIVLADTSFVLLCLILMLGAAARYVPRLRRLVPWNRELGIAMFVTAGLHVVILLEYSPRFGTLVSFEDVRDAFFAPYGFVTGDNLYAAANWVGLFALGYALVLAATSNDFSQRLLGRGWKFTQRQTYTLFVLVWLHTAAFLVDLDRFPPAFTWFWMFTILAVVTQMSGFVHTVRSTRGPSPQRAPSKTRTETSRAGAVAAARWLAVAALWGVVIIGSWSLATAELRNEERMVAIFCERYDELEGLPSAEIRDKLIDFLPADGSGLTFNGWVFRCQEG